MDPRQLFADERLTGMCVHCGGEPQTRDHAPSKVLLDDPLPSDVPVVDACESCNASFSQDEEYTACLVECAICGTTDPTGIQRPKIKRILGERPALAAKLNQCCTRSENGGLVWQPEFARVRNVVLKLARSHIAYELSLPRFDEPEVIDFVPMLSLSEHRRAEFESPASSGMVLWPEIGSRAFIAACRGRANMTPDGWINLQPGRYRYRVDQLDGDSVQMVLSEYLACRVVWS